MLFSHPSHQLPCPACLGPNGSLLLIGREAISPYFRCDACGHVWTATKHDDHTMALPSTDEPLEPGSGSAVLDVVCGTCQSDVSISYEINSQRGRYRSQRWLCPICSAPNWLNLAGGSPLVTIRLMP